MKTVGAPGAVVAMMPLFPVWKQLKGVAHTLQYDLAICSPFQQGTLLPEGWGAAAGYPGIILDEHGAEVAGFLFSSHALAEHWPRLDAFEGEGYERVLTTATRRDGTAVEAYVYALASQPGGRRRGPMDV